MINHEIEKQENKREVALQNQASQVNNYSALSGYNPPSDNLFEEEKMEGINVNDDEGSEYELEATDKYSVCHTRIKQNYTIKQKYTKKGGISERLAICKTKNCPAKAKLCQYGNDSNATTELYYKKISHLPSCKTIINPFQNPKLQEYLELGLKPKVAIARFNKQNADQKIENNAGNRKKVSQLKYINNLKNEEENPVITNINDLKAWIESKTHLTNNDNAFNSLPWDVPFIANYSINNHNFIAVITTKNSLHNFIKQAACDSSLISIDGTYQLNVQGFPTLVIGTCDLHKKFHLGKVFYRNIIDFMYRCFCNYKY